MLDRLSLTLLSFSAVTLFAGAPAAIGQQAAAARELHQLFADEWDRRLQRDPLFASTRGISDYNDRLPDMTAEAQRQALEEDLQFLERLEAIDRAALTPDDRTNRDVFEFVVGHRANLATYRADSIFFTPFLDIPAYFSAGDAERLRAQAMTTIADTVVPDDLGMHYKGWSRDEALRYLADNTALSLRNVRTEIDRYISWPGQALAYKMGELKFLELRARATEALGEDFDIRDFHDAVLINGGLPLDMLDGVVDRYIDSVGTGESP